MISRYFHLSAALALTLLLVATVFGVAAWHMSLGSMQKPGPAVVPLIFATLLFACASALLIRNERTAEPAPSIEARRAVVLIVLIVLFYPALLRWVGFALSTIGLVASVALILRLPRWQAIGLAFGSVIVAYIVFAILLDVRLPRGVVGF